MKRIVSTTLVFVLCSSLLAIPCAAAASTNDDSQSIVMSEISISNQAGEIVCTVDIPEAYATASVASGASIQYKGTTALQYINGRWTAKIPSLSDLLIQRLIEGFLAVQAAISRLVSIASHDGKSYVSVKTVDGNDCYPVGGGIWACRYSL